MTWLLKPWTTVEFLFCVFLFLLLQTPGPGSSNDTPIQKKDFGTLEAIRFFLSLIHNTNTLDVVYGSKVTQHKDRKLSSKAHSSRTSPYSWMGFVSQSSQICGYLWGSFTHFYHLFSLLFSFPLMCLDTKLRQQPFASHLLFFDVFWTYSHDCVTSWTRLT